MTIHHDKMAYGKVAPNMEEISESDILKMLKKLEEEAEQNNKNTVNTCSDDKKGDK
jgi:hypothetical protein